MALCVNLSLSSFAYVSGLLRVFVVFLAVKIVCLVCAFVFCCSCEMNLVVVEGWCLQLRDWFCVFAVCCLLVVVSVCVCVVCVCVCCACVCVCVYIYI